MPNFFPDSLVWDESSRAKMMAATTAMTQRLLFSTHGFHVYDHSQIIMPGMIAKKSAGRAFRNIVLIAIFSGLGSAGWALGGEWCASFAEGYSLMFKRISYWKSQQPADCHILEMRFQCCVMIINGTSVCKEGKDVHNWTVNKGQSSAKSRRAPKSVTLIFGK